MKTLLVALLLSAGIAQAHEKPKNTHYVQYILINGVVIAHVLPVLPETRTPEQIKRAKVLKEQFLQQEDPAHRYMREKGMFDTTK